MTFSSLLLTVVATNAETHCPLRKYERKEVKSTVCPAAQDEGVMSLERCIRTCEEDINCGVALYGRSDGSATAGRCLIKGWCTSDDFNVVESSEDSVHWDSYARRCDDEEYPIIIDVDKSDDYAELKCPYRRYERYEVKDTVCPADRDDGMISLSRCIALCDADRNCAVAVHGREDGAEPNRCIIKGWCTSDDFNVVESSKVSTDYDSYVRRCDDIDYPTIEEDKSDDQTDDYPEEVPIVNPDNGECNYVRYENREVKSELCASSQSLGKLSLEDCLIKCDDDTYCNVAVYGHRNTIWDGFCIKQTRCIRDDFDLDNDIYVTKSSAFDSYARRCTDEIIDPAVPIVDPEDGECNYIKFDESEVSNKVCKSSDYKGATSLDECLSMCDSDEACGVALYGRKSGNYAGTCYLQGHCGSKDFDMKKTSLSSTDWDAYARRCDPDAIKTTASPNTEGKCDYKEYPGKEVRSTVCESSLFVGKKTLQQCQTACDADELCGVALYGRASGVYIGLCYLQTDCVYDNFNVDRVSIESRNWDAYARRCDDDESSDDVTSPTPAPELGCNWHKYSNREVWDTVCKSSNFIGQVTLDECTTACEDDKDCGIAHYGITGMIFEGKCFLMSDCVSDDFGPDRYSSESKNWDVYAFRCDEGFTNTTAVGECEWKEYLNTEILGLTCQHHQYPHFSKEQCLKACDDDDKCEAAQYGRDDNPNHKGMCEIRSQCIAENFPIELNSMSSNAWDTYARRCDEESSDEEPMTLGPVTGCYWHKYANRDVWRSTCKSEYLLRNKTLDECITSCEADDNCGVAQYGLKDTGMAFISDGGCFLMGDCVSDDFDVQKLSSRSNEWDVYAFRCDEGFTNTTAGPTEAIETQVPETRPLEIEAGTEECEWKEYMAREVLSPMCDDEMFLQGLTKEQCLKACDNHENCAVAHYGREESNFYAGKCSLRMNCSDDNFSVEANSLPSMGWNAYARRCEEGGGDEIVTPVNCYWHKYAGRELWRDTCRSQYFLRQQSLEECIAACEGDAFCGAVNYGIEWSSMMLAADGGCMIMGDCVSDDFDPQRFSSQSDNWDIHAYRCD